MVSQVENFIDSVGREPQGSSSTPGPEQDNPKNHTMCLGALSKYFLNSVRFGAAITSLASLAMSNHILGEKPFPNILCKHPSALPHDIPLDPVTGYRQQRSVLPLQCPS